MKTMLALIAAVLALSPAAGLEVGKPVADITLGQDSLAALAKEGKIAAVYFWSEKCPYGPPMWPALKEVSSKYADNAKVKLISVASFAKDTQAAAEKWAKENDLKGPMVHDGDRKIARHFGASKVNCTYVIDAKGLLYWAGGIDKLGAALQAALEGKPAPASDLKYESFKGCGINIQ